MCQFMLNLGGISRFQVGIDVVAKNASEFISKGLFCHILQ